MQSLVQLHFVVPSDPNLWAVSGPEENHHNNNYKYMNVI